MIHSVTHSNTQRSAMMITKQYTILDLSELFEKDKQLIRRRLTKLGIKAINKGIREYANEPLQYDHNAYIELAKDFGVSNSKIDQPTDDTQSNTQQYANDTQSNTQKHTNDTQCNTQIHADDIGRDKLIEVLERELEHSKIKLQRAEQEKDNLYRLLDQQQQLSLNDKNKIETLELELKESNYPEQTLEEKPKWYNIFKRRKSDS